MSKAYVSAALKRLVCNRADFACEYCLIKRTIKQL